MASTPLREGDTHATFSRHLEAVRKAIRELSNDFVLSTPPGDQDRLAPRLSLAQRPAPPEDLAAVAFRVAEEGGLHGRVVDDGVGLEDQPRTLQLGALPVHVIDQERDVADPSLID